MPNRSADIARIQKLIWAYFFLLIFEGALRKWVMPSLATPLLIVRDPIVLGIYFFAWRQNLFPRNSFILFGVPIALFSLVAGTMSQESTPAVAVFGFRANFLHLPLIFVIPKAFGPREVQRMGYWLLLLAVPMAALMAVQFMAAPDAWINSGDDNKFGQIDAARGHIRPPGTFSFISGPVHFFAFVTAFLLYGQFVKSRYPLWLQGACVASVLIACVVSSSRSLIGTVAVVFGFAFFVSSVLRPWLIFRWIWCISLIALLSYALSDVEFFREGLLTFSDRMANAEISERRDDGGGALGRVIGGFLAPLPRFLDAPLWGHGLGMGTNGGSALLIGRVEFLLDEGEWGRILLESGPILGGAFIVWRVALVLWLASHAVRLALHNNPLPMLLLGVCALPMMQGSFGQPTSLGFAVLSTGLCLAAMRTEPVRRRVLVQQPAPETPSFGGRAPQTA